jgi:hypothetical protein
MHTDSVRRVSSTVCNSPLKRLPAAGPGSVPDDGKLQTIDKVACCAIYVHGFKNPQQVPRLKVTSQPVRHSHASSGMHAD